MNLKAKVSELKADFKKVAQIFDCAPGAVTQIQLEYVTKTKYEQVFGLLGGYRKLRAYLFPVNSQQDRQNAEAVQKLLKAVGSK